MTRYNGQKPDVLGPCQKPGNLREKRLQMRHVQVGVNFCTTAPVLLESEDARIACIALQVMRHATEFGAGNRLHHYQENFRGELKAAPFGVLGPQLGQNSAISTSLRFLDPGEADNIITPSKVPLIGCFAAVTTTLEQLQVNRRRQPLGLRSDFESKTIDMSAHKNTDEFKRDKVA